MEEGGGGSVGILFSGCPSVRSISWENFDGFWLNFAYALILMTSSLGLLSVHFRQFVTGLRPYPPHTKYGGWRYTVFRLSVRLSIRNIFFSAPYLKKTYDGFWPNFAYALILMTSNLGFLSVHFCQFVTGLRPLNDVRISFPLNILRMKDWTIFDQIWFWPNFAYALLLMTSSLGLFRVHFPNLLQSYGTWMTSECRFRSISWVWKNEFWLSFAHALLLTTSAHALLLTTSSLGLLLTLTLTRSRLVLLHINFCNCLTELLPLIDVKISLPLNILRNSWQNLTKFCICIDIENMYVGIVTHQFSQINNRVMALDWCWNFDSAQLIEFDQILHMHWYWQDICWDC